MLLGFLAGNPHTKTVAEIARFAGNVI